MLLALRIAGIACLALALSGAARAQASAAPKPAPAKLSAPAAKAEPGAKPEAADAVAAKKPEAPLDVQALKARLRDTKAIGFFTKLELQNQVNDLLQQFREHYESGKNASVATLRQPYDLLVMKVLALLQDSDPALATTILQSREAIWKILADPEKFKSIS